MRVVIVDYGSGNLRSAAKAVERAAGVNDRATEVLVTGDPDAVARADRLVLPGVGAFGDCRAGLRARDGLDAAVRETATKRSRPFLGICVGMQLMAERGLEHGEHEGFGWIAGDVTRLRPTDETLKIPHMGWNEIVIGEAGRDHPVLADLPENAHGYFVHSYHFEAKRSDAVLATAEYGGPVTAMVGRDTMVGTQFHPEKSQATGARILSNFLAWCP